MSSRQSDSVRVLAYADSSLFSGAESVHCDLMRGLCVSPEIELRCAAPHSNTALVERLREATGEEPIDIPAQRPSAAAFDLYSPARRAAVGKALAQAPCDVLYVNLPSAEYGPTPMVAKPAPAVKSVGLLHVPGSFSELDFRFGWLREWLARRAMSRFDTVCVIAQSAARTCERVWTDGEVPVPVIPLPMPHVERISCESARLELGLPSGPLVGMAGRISFKQKGQDTFIEAAAQLIASGSELRFAFAGEGSDLPRLRDEVARLGLTGRVFFLGQVEPIDRFLSAIDAIAIPSRFEGLPLIALEALSCGVPGIASNVDGLIDVWPEPWRVEPGDAASLAEGLTRVLEMPSDQRALLIDQGREFAAACTDPNPAAALESVILQVANG